MLNIGGVTHFFSASSATLFDFDDLAGLFTLLVHFLVAGHCAVRGAAACTVSQEVSALEDTFAQMLPVFAFSSFLKSTLAADIPGYQQSATATLLEFNAVLRPA